MNLSAGLMKLNKWTMLLQLARSINGLKKNLAVKGQNLNNNSNDSKMGLSPETNQQIPSPTNQQPQKEKWIDPKDARNWARLRMGHEAMMLDKIQRQNKMVENTVKGLQDDAGLPTEINEEDMGVSIGNETHYHQAPNAMMNEKLLEVLTSKKEQEKKPNPWLPLSVVAAGAMTGAGLYYGQDKTIQNNPVAQQETVDIGVGFGKPEIIKLEETDE